MYEYIFIIFTHVHQLNYLLTLYVILEISTTLHYYWGKAPFSSFKAEIVLSVDPHHT